nr:hypothetical protein [Tanacetum cinerariifolium]
MAHQQLVDDVHPDELCPSNKQYDLMDANKKIDLEHVQCPPKSKILMNVIKNHPLRLSIAASSSSVPWIYMAQFWHTLKEDSSKAAMGRNSLFSSSFNIFDSLSKIHEDHPWRYKDKVGMKIPDWMISEEMKQTEHYRMYAEVFGIDVLLIQSPPTESTQGTHRTPSAPRQKQEARENVALVKKHLASEEIEKMVERQEHVVDDSSIPRNDEHNILGTRAKFMPRKSFVTLDDHLRKAMADSLPTMVGKHIKEQVEKQVPKQQAIDNDIPSQVDASVRSYLSRHIFHVHLAQPKTTYVLEQQYQLYLSMKDDPHWQQQDIAIWGRIVQSGRRHQSMEHMYMESHRLDRIMNRNKVHQHQEQGPSTSGNQEQADDYDCWTDSYALNDDEIPTKQVSQDIMEEVSLNVDEAKLNKIVDEMLRQRCTSGDEHQYHIDQMKNFLKNDIVWESRMEILISSQPRKITPFVLRCQRDPEAPALSLINQDLLYLKKGNSRPKKIVLSLHKFHAVVFNDDDIKEQTSRWVNKCVKKFNPYARYEIIARKANDCIVSIIEPDFKNLNKNDIEDMYLLIMNGKLSSYVLSHHAHADLQYSASSSHESPADPHTLPATELLSRVNERHMQTIEEKVDKSKALDASSVDTESSRTDLKEHDTSSRPGNDAHDDDAEIRPIYDEELMAEVDTRKALDASLVDTKSSRAESVEQDTSSRSGNDVHADDADIIPIYDEEPMANVHTTAEINIFATGQQYTKQLEFNNEGDVDQNTKQCHDTCPLPAKLTDNQKLNTHINLSNLKIFV